MEKVASILCIPPAVLFFGTSFPRWMPLKRPPLGPALSNRENTLTQKNDRAKPQECGPAVDDRTVRLPRLRDLVPSVC